ncbi:MAG: hypothetical protein DI534_06780 [Leifsonia xyli]|nr:MAG: hypothetical protein DI534_06780 [Leifsonia xyli]
MTSLLRSRGRRILAVLLAGLLGAAASIAGAAPSYAATVNLTVNLASVRGPSTGVGQGLLYGVTQDATQPGNRFIQPLRLNSYRGGGHASGGWIRDNYVYGAGTKADVAEAIAQATRLKALSPSPSTFQYQFILSDVFGADGGQPSNTRWPCANGDCTNWISFIDSVVTPLQNSGLTFVYDIWNEPDISAFWPNASVNSTQYFQMWDAAVKEIRRIAPSAKITGPSFAYSPLARASQWNTWLSHVKAAGTVPDWISNHAESGGDDPVALANAINSALSNNGIPAKPLSANEYQQQGQGYAGTTAWFLARFAQSGYTNAQRGNWDCCQLPNITGMLTNDGLSTNGSWWAMRAYADLTGSLVTTTGLSGTTAIAASIDSTAKRAVAIIGDTSTLTGTVNVTFTGLSSVSSWLASGGKVNVVVDRIPDGTIGAPRVVSNANVSVSGGSITVAVPFTAARDAYAVYLTPAGRSGALTGTGSGRCVDVPSANQTNGTQLNIWDCNGQTNQLWHATASGELRTFNDAFCLDANNNGTANGTQLIIWSCSGAANQKWTVGADGTVKGVQSGRCVTVNGGATANGSQLVLSDCTGASNQKWSLPNN